MNNIVILGTGGHANVLAEALRAAGQDNIRFVAPKDEGDLLAAGPKHVLLVNGVGSVGDASHRRSIYNKFRMAGFTFLAVIHPSAVIAADAEVAEGAQIMAGAVLQTGVRVGLGAIINTGAIIDHDSVISAYAHVATGARLAGNVAIGECAHIGAGATIIQGANVGPSAVVGMGAVVVGDVPSGITVTGIPARQKS